MKKLIVLAAALLLGFQAKAQIVADAGFQLAFENTKLLLDDATYASHPNTFFGVYAGANYYFNLDDLVDGLAALPGMNVSFLIGHHWDFHDVKAREVAINLPLQASYTHELNDNLKIFGQTGPTLQFALSHKVDDGYGTTYNLLNKSNKFGESRKPFNLYWGLAAGVELNDQFRFDVGYDFGLLNLSRESYLKTHRGFLHLGVGYLF